MALIFSIFLWPPEPLLQYPFLRAQISAIWSTKADRGMLGVMARLTTASLLMVSQVVGSCILLMMVAGFDYYVCVLPRCPQPREWGPKKASQGQNIARTAPKKFLNKSRGLPVITQ